MPQRWGRVFLVFSVGLMMSSSALGHHSVNGVFDASKPITVTGIVSKVEWVNPHIHIYVDVTDDKGESITWAMETFTPAMARRAGLSAEAVWGDGEPITVDAIEAWDASLNRGYIRKITFADGRFVQMNAPQ